MLRLWKLTRTQVMDTDLKVSSAHHLGAFLHLGRKQKRNNVGNVKKIPKAHGMLFYIKMNEFMIASFLHSVIYLKKLVYVNK